nr:PREDICTED: LYR motif-containing protein 4 [Struthio camelus australis]
MMPMKSSDVAHGYRKSKNSNWDQTYAIRRIRDAFRENKNIKDSEKIEELVNKAKANLEIIHRQVTIGQLYSTQKLVIESPGNT